MSLKTILVHLADNEEHRTRLDAAVRLARKHQAQVVALYITTPLGMPAEIAGRGASAVYLDEAVKHARQEALKLQDEFQAVCRRDSIEYSWITEEGEHLDLLSRHAHAADLVIVSQPEIEHLEDRFRLMLPEELVMNAGLPVLLLPKGYQEAEIGRDVLVAWNGSREAARAVRDARPILQLAEEIAVLSVGPDIVDALSLHEIVSHLKRHDIDAKPRNIAAYDKNVAQVILDNAATQNSDLLIMGAYGHSRLREIMMGGITRHIISHATLPVLMSH